MRLLFVTDVFPYPPYHGSAVISYHWARSLAARHEIAVLPVSPPREVGDARALQQMGIHLISSTSYANHEAMWHALSLLPKAIRAIRLGELRAAFHQAVGTVRPDASLLIGPALSALLPTRPPGQPIVFVPYDAESENIRMRLSHTRHLVRRLHAGLEQKKWAAVERTLYPLADACVAVTEDDARALSRAWPPGALRSVHVIPNGVDVTHFRPSDGPEVPGRLVITGNMWSIESRISVQWFLQSVLPVIRRQVPEVTVDIVGRDPGPDLQGLAQGCGGVVVHGFVPDITPFLVQACVYVAPLRLGSGIKNRVLEALAAGKAVVGTPHSIRGLQVEPGRDLLQAGTVEAFSNSVVQVLQNDTLRRALGTAARRAVEASHTWEVAAARVEALLATLPGMAGRTEGELASDPMQSPEADRTVSESPVQ